MMPEMRPLCALIWLTGVCVAAQVQPKRLPPASEATSTQNTDYVYRVGKGVSAPILIYKKEPEYSEEASRAGLQGTVVLSFVVRRNGRAQNIRVIQSVGLGLDEKAIQSVQMWKFKPGMKDGKQVSVFAITQVNFCIAGRYCPTWKSAEDSK
jgi:TonB family protein